MFALLTQRRLRWLGHVSRMEDGRIPKDILYGELATGSRRAGRILLRSEDVRKRDMRVDDIHPAGWKAVTGDRGRWREAVGKSSQLGERMRENRLGGGQGDPQKPTTDE